MEHIAICCTGMIVTSVSCCTHDVNMRQSDILCTAISKFWCRTPLRIVTDYNNSPDNILVLTYTSNIIITTSNSPGSLYYHILHYAYIYIYIDVYIMIIMLGHSMMQNASAHRHCLGLWCQKSWRVHNKQIIKVTLKLQKSYLASNPFSPGTSASSLSWASSSLRSISEMFKSIYFFRCYCFKSMELFRFPKFPIIYFTVHIVTIMLKINDSYISLCSELIIKIVLTNINNSEKVKINHITNC